VAAEQSDAIVLRIHPWSETSLIAHMLTRQFGKISVLAKGARRPKGPFEAALDLLSICRVVFIPKASDALDILTEAKLQKRFRAGSSNLLRLYAGYYLAELLDRGLDRSVESHSAQLHSAQEQVELFDFCVDTLRLLDDPEHDVGTLVLRFEMQFLRLTGLMPTLTHCAACGDEIAARTDSTQRESWSVFSASAGGVLCRRCRGAGRNTIRLQDNAIMSLRRFATFDWRSIDTSAPISSDRAAIRAVVQKYLTYQLDRKLQLHSYLEELGR